jgi:hypothetical protein
MLRALKEYPSKGSKTIHKSIKICFLDPQEASQDADVSNLIFNLTKLGYKALSGSDFIRVDSVYGFNVSYIGGKDYLVVTPMAGGFRFYNGETIRVPEAVIPQIAIPRSLIRGVILSKIKYVTEFSKNEVNSDKYQEEPVDDYNNLDNDQDEDSPKTGWTGKIRRKFF